MPKNPTLDICGYKIDMFDISYFVAFFIPVVSALKPGSMFLQMY